MTELADPTASGTSAAATPFHDLEEFIALPRVSGLALSPDGTRLITTVATLDPKRTGFVSAVWEVDPTGAVPARRLTRSSKGERAPAFTAGGDVLFLSGRPDPDAAPDAKDDEPPAALWLLPAGGGEARVVGTRPGGIGAVSAAAAAETVVVHAKTLPGAVTGEDDEERRKERKDRKVSAILHSGYPIRFWDHDLGPDQPRLLAGALPGDGAVEWDDLTGDIGAALIEVSTEIAPDGGAVFTGWRIPEPLGDTREAVVRIDVATGRRTTLADDVANDHYHPRVSPDGSTVAAIRLKRNSPTEAPELHLVLMPADGSGAPAVLAEEWDRWPGDMRWTPDGGALIVAADDNGRGRLFRIEVADGTVVRLTGDDAAYTDPWVSPDGRHVYALRNGIGAPPAPVRLDAREAGQEPTLLPGPVPAPALSGTLTEVTASAQDGTELRAWLALPADADANPAPLLLWIHGGPLHSWNSWTWRWNPWLMAAQGYAVLLPDPALSTGYGQRMIDRGWAQWGKAPYTDLMAITDAAEALPEIDASRTAAMGGSFGGYMANWIAGHTARFRAIVTHASLWALDQFGPTTDDAAYWVRGMTDEIAIENSPHLAVDRITTPVLVIHGDKDYRVPIGEALRLWWELLHRQEDPESQPHRFLYFPDENHWILKPQHSIVWYETVLAFLAHHVLGEEWKEPEILR